MSNRSLRSWSELPAEQEYKISYLSGNLQRKLVSDLSTFKSLKHLEMDRPYGLRLEEVDAIPDACPKLVSLKFIRSYGTIINIQNRLENSIVALLDKISLLKPKTGLKKLVFSLAVDGGEETLIYIMRILPNLETLHFNRISRRDRGSSDHVTTSFLQYVIERKDFETGYISCEVVASILPVCWHSEELKAAGKKALSLSIEINHHPIGRSHAEHYISMSSSKREVAVYYGRFHETFLPIELIEIVGFLFLTHLKIRFDLFHGMSTIRDKMDINMPYTRFEKLHITRSNTTSSRNRDMFVKYSNENGDRYFYASLNSYVTEFSEFSHTEYNSKLASTSTYFVDIRCQAVRELIIEFGYIGRKRLALNNI
ncbi:hypothetical protein HPULCUR_005327 [Helicostylum pulchrum]|uniref:Uncharacterized protein n=1 Tax=Helicostylum pulchrum TaxID=562976 RepID=A0ABP9XYR4_9FUNG